ncbi:MAG: hypothetical protein AAGA48_26745 [Myxococcota bacterium]
MAGGPDETTAHDLLAAIEPPDVSPPRRIAERRVVGGATVTRLLQRRAFRPVGNSRRFWSRLEEDDPFVPAPPRAALGPLASLPPVGRTASEGAAEGSPVRTGAPVRKPEATPPVQARGARPRSLEAPSATSGGARPRSPDTIPQPRTAAPRPAKAPQAAEAVDRRPPIVPVRGLPAGPTTPGRVRMPKADPSAGRQAPKPRSSEPAAPPRGNTIDDYVAYVSELQQIEREYRERQAEEETAPSKPRSVPRRPTGGLDDLMDDAGEGRVRIPRPTRRREEG